MLDRQTKPLSEEPMCVLVTGVTWCDARVMMADLRERLDRAGVPNECMRDCGWIKTPYCNYHFISAHAPNAEQKLRGMRVDGWLYDDDSQYPLSFKQMVRLRARPFAFKRHFAIQDVREPIRAS